MTLAPILSLTARQLWGSCALTLTAPNHKWTSRLWLSVIARLVQRHQHTILGNPKALRGTVAVILGFILEPWCSIKQWGRWGNKGQLLDDCRWFQFGLGGKCIFDISNSTEVAHESYFYQEVMSLKREQSYLKAHWWNHEPSGCPQGILGCASLMLKHIPPPHCGMAANISKNANLRWNANLLPLVPSDSLIHTVLELLHTVTSWIPTPFYHLCLVGVAGAVSPHLIEYEGKVRLLEAQWPLQAMS